MQILTKEMLLILALSPCTHPDGLTMNEIVRTLKATFNLSISESAARTASKELISLGLVDNGVRKVPADRRAAAGHYRLTAEGREKFRETIGILNGIVLRAGVRGVSD